MTTKTYPDVIKYYHQLYASVQSVYMLAHKLTEVEENLEEKFPIVVASRRWENMEQYPR